jgi:nicotinamidase-related amidase
MTAAHLVVIDMQHVFADPGSGWNVPRFGEAIAPIERLIATHAPRVTLTRFIAPARPEGAWVSYYERFPFALQPPEAELYRLVAPIARHAADGTLDTTTLSKWTPELAAAVGPGGELVVAGVATDSCVIATALAAADAGVRVRVAADACAGADDAVHDQALAVLRTWAPLIDVTSTERIVPPG